MERRARLPVLIAAGGILAALAAAPGPSDAKLLRTRDEALRAVFGDGVLLVSRTAFLTPGQADAVRQAARAPFDAARVTYWEARRGDAVVGRAYLDTHAVRSLTETVLVAVDPGGAVRAVEILAFHEPADYLPPSRWLHTLASKSLADPLRPGQDVDGISGATLSVRASTDAVRRALALERVLHGEAG